MKPERKPMKQLPDPNELKWSKEASDPMTWKEASDYCSALTENNFSDWRLPNIDELRTLIQNCDKTRAGGSCKISENRQCLDEKCWSEDCNGCNDKSDILWAKKEAMEKELYEKFGWAWIHFENSEYEKAEEDYRKQNIADFKNTNFSRIQSKNAFWSSTLDPENIGEAWGVDFINARVGHMSMFIDVYDNTGSDRRPSNYDYKLKVICVR